MGFLPVRRILAAGLSILSSAAYSQTAILGILEEHPGTYYGDSSYRGIRVVFQKDGSEWKPVENLVPYGVEKDRYNVLTFKPVTTSGMRLEVTAQPNWSIGIEEWKLK
jgi:hypothetical protein